MADITYPIAYEIDRPEKFNRWTVAFRPILAIPQLLLVGVRGVLGTVLGVLTLFAWVAILFTGRFPRSFRALCFMIFRWEQNVRAYVLLQAAPYPPFSDGPYDLTVTITPAEHYNRWAVAFRPILIIPHAVVLAFLLFAQAIVTVITWFAVLITGRFPEGLFHFSVGVSRWTARVEAYMYLFVDEYPPFSLGATPAATTGAMRPQPA